MSAMTMDQVYSVVTSTVQAERVLRFEDGGGEEKEGVKSGATMVSIL
jgi:hypothetical protein